MITVMRYIVSYSGGLCSWFAASRLIERHGKKAVTLLFADTNFEDPDLYRFLDETSADFGVPITRIADGRTPWDVFFDKKFIGNSRIDLCSRILKRELLDKWHNQHCLRSNTVICVGLSRSESARYIRFKRRLRVKGWRAHAPAMAPPYASKLDMLEALRERGIDPPSLYEDGFAHNNCGGFCVKQGIAGFRLLLAKKPDFYRFNEEKEQEFRQLTGKNVAIMRDREGGRVRPLTMKAFRERVEAGKLWSVADDSTACGCAID